MILAPVVIPATKSAAALTEAGWAERVKYRIDATITIFGMTVFSRKEVGWAGAEIQNKDGKLRFQFSGASLPERTRGIKMCGHFEEVLELEGVRRSQYFGFISAPMEAKPNQAVLAGFEAPRKRKDTCCVVEGHWTPTEASFRKSYEAEAPEGTLDPAGEEFARAMRRELETKCSAGCLNGRMATKAGYTFLSALLEAARPEKSRTRLTYHYGDTVLSLDAKSQRDREGNGFVVDAEARGKSPHRFQFHCDAPGQLPTRIEYHPKPWLKLTLEAQANHKERA